MYRRILPFRDFGTNGPIKEFGENEPIRELVTDAKLGLSGEIARVVFKLVVEVLYNDVKVAVALRYVETNWAV